MRTSTLTTEVAPAITIMCDTPCRCWSERYRFLALAVLFRASHWWPLALVPLVFVRKIPRQIRKNPWNSAKIPQNSAKFRNKSANFRKIPQQKHKIQKNKERQKTPDETLHIEIYRTRISYAPFFSTVSHVLGLANLSLYHHTTTMQWKPIEVEYNWIAHSYYNFAFKIS